MDVARSSLEHGVMPARIRLPLVIVLGTSVVAAGIAACGGGGSAPGGGIGPGNDDASVEGGGFDLDGGTGDPGKLAKIEIEPATAALTVTNGDLSAASASVTFQAKATYADGRTAAFNGCTWSIDRIDLGSFTASTLKASGGAGGKGTVTCSASGLSAKAAVTVDLVDEVDDAGLDATTKKDLVAASIADPQVKKLLYPYDKTVLPRGVAAPELMWTGASASDVYALRLAEPGMTYTAYFKAGTPARATIPGATWTKLLDTATPTTPLTATLYRLAGGAGGTAFKSTSQSWTIANANLKGSIYYWRINGGTVVRIKPGASAPEAYLKPSGGRCIACHSVSHDGSTLVASSDNAGPYPWSSFDAKSGAETYFGPGTNSGFQAVSPDGSMVLAGVSAGTMQLVTSAGASLEPSGAAAFGSTVTHPAFAPNGKWVAFASRKGGSWVDFNDSDLTLAPFDPATKKFGAPKVLRAGAGRALTYPTFSPDSEWIAYMDGTQSTRPSIADLHMMKVDGTGDVTLDAAGNAGVDPVDKSLNYEPTFGPVVAGGYYWVVFVSTRQYGNRINKTFDAFRDKCGDWSKTPCRHKQLWVAAIDADPKPGADPSHPAFWLPGQDTADQNMRGYWALDPCKKLGEGCEAGFECCEGTCRSEDGKSPKVCVKPPAGTCRELGDKCETTADCCASSTGIECIGGVCGTKRPS